MTLPHPAWLMSYLPTLPQAAAVVAVLASGMVLLVLGRAVLGARTLPEIAIMAGWGVLSLVLTLWGVLTPMNMRIPAAALIGIAALAAITPRGRLAAADLIALGRLLVLALPLIAVFSAAYPSQPDTFTNQLPNTAYLYDYGEFPGINRPPILAVWPAFPYNLQLAAFLPAMLGREFPVAVLTHVNLLLQFAFALLLARGMRGANVPAMAPPSWAAIAGGLLLTSFLNPGFNPKIQFSGYGDPAIAVAIAFAAWQAERLLAALAAGGSGASERLSFTVLLLAASSIKQVSIVLTGALVLVTFVLGASDRRIGSWRALGATVPAFLPSLLMVGVWRFYVTTHFAPDAELRLLSPEQWDFGKLPEIFANMASRIYGRLPYFALLYGVALAAIPLAFRRGHGGLARLFLLTLGMTLLYTAFLVFTYVAHFAGEIGASAHSFFRYSTHLGLLATLALVELARETWLERGAPRLGGGWRLVEAGAIVLALAAPVAAARWVRYDLRQPQPLVWELARFAAPHLRDGDRVALLLPGDNRSVAFMLRDAIAMTGPHHRLAQFDDIPRADAAALKEARDKGDTFALVSCVPADFTLAGDGKPDPAPAGQAALLLNDHGTWRLAASHAYPPDLPPTPKWTPELSPGPFCR